MRRRKSHRRRSTSRRRRVGGILSQDKLMKAGGVILGVIATGFINEKIAEMKNTDGTPKVDPKIVALGEVILGFVLPNFVKNDLVEGIGMGMIGAGGVNAAKGFGLISGIPIVGGVDHLRIVGALPAAVQKFVPGAAPKSTASQVITGVMNGWHQ
jgi:hypothetical protein